MQVRLAISITCSLSTGNSWSNTSPGPLTPTRRPNRNTTSRINSGTTRIELANTATTRITTTRSAITATTHSIRNITNPPNAEPHSRRHSAKPSTKPHTPPPTPSNPPAPSGATTPSTYKPQRTETPRDAARRWTRPKHVAPKTSQYPFSAGNLSAPKLYLKPI